ncbi:hypothetical protein [Phormidium pseudopriestleyi]|nr:hypothetical protein [Phormidium pseudopriestleyi]
MKVITGKCKHLLQVVQPREGVESSDLEEGSGPIAFHSLPE